MIRTPVKLSQGREGRLAPLLFEGNFQSSASPLSRQTTFRYSFAPQVAVCLAHLGKRERFVDERTNPAFINSIKEHFHPSQLSPARATCDRGLIEDTTVLY